MRRITKRSHCFSCREKCCSFARGERYFAPLFTEEEIERIKPVVKELPKFAKKGGSDNVFQVRLVRSKNNPSLKVCPFFCEERGICTIHDRAPFDCTLWPFMITWDKKIKHVGIYCVEPGICPGLDNIKKEDFEKYKNYIIRLVLTKRYLWFLRTHPALILAFEDDSFLVKDITGALFGANEEH